MELRRISIFSLDMWKLLDIPCTSKFAFTCWPLSVSCADRLLADMAIRRLRLFGMKWTTFASEWT